MRRNINGKFNRRLFWSVKSDARRVTRVLEVNQCCSTLFRLVSSSKIKIPLDSWPLAFSERVKYFSKWRFGLFNSLKPLGLLIRSSDPLEMNYIYYRDAVSLTKFPHLHSIYDNPHTCESLNHVCLYIFEPNLKTRLCPQLYNIHSVRKKNYNQNN